MSTHQEIAGVSDQDLIDRMVRTHENRFDDPFWDFFERNVGTNLSDKSLIVDVGCGPGLLLRDLRQRYPHTTLFGYDITPAMIEYARNEVSFEGEHATFAVGDITSESLSQSDESVDLLVMVAVLHVLAEPLSVMKELKRVIKPGGTFLLHDWIRSSLPAYLDRMMENVPVEAREKAQGQMYRLFASHNKYTTEDWLWLLDKAGFRVTKSDQLGSIHFRTFVCEKVRQD